MCAKEGNVNTGAVDPLREICRAAMRISASSWATTTADVDRSLEAIVRLAREHAGPGR